VLFGIMREKEDWRGAYDYLAASVPPTDVIAVCPIHNYPTLRYHAVAPVAATVLAIETDGRLVQIENGLHTNPDWDKTYFHHHLTERSLPAARASRLIGRRAAAYDPGIAASLKLIPGQSVWRVDGHCSASYAADMDARLSGIDPNADVVWLEKRNEPISQGGYPITIRRYRVSVPVQLQVTGLRGGPAGGASLAPLAPR
jgi:hypothetical protein